MSAGHQRGVTLITYQGEIVATVGASRCYLSPRIEAMDADDPLAVFVSVMAAYALDVRDGSAPGRYTHERAERFARLVLIDDDEFRMLDANQLEDSLLAGHFEVPVEQIEA